MSSEKRVSEFYGDPRSFHRESKYSVNTSLSRQIQMVSSYLDMIREYFDENNFTDLLNQIEQGEQSSLGFKSQAELFEFWKNLKAFPYDFFYGMEKICFYDGLPSDIVGLSWSISNLCENLNKQQFDAYNYILKLTRRHIYTTTGTTVPDEISAQLDTQKLFESKFEIINEISNSIKITEYKNKRIVPKYVAQLKKFINAGFCLDLAHLQNCEDLLYKVPFELSPDDIEQYSSGTYNQYRFVASLTFFNPFEFPNPAEDIICHELNHLLSAFSEVDDWESLCGLRRPKIAYADATNPPIIFEFERALNEAFTESLTVWINSGRVPNFKDMTVAKFFRGPGIFRGSYELERKFFIKKLGEMPIENLTRAYFTDYCGPDISKATTPQFSKLIEDIEMFSRNTYEEFAFQFGDFLAKNNYREQNKPRLSRRQKLAFEVVAGVTLISNVWSDNPKIDPQMPVTHSINAVWDAGYMPIRELVIDGITFAQQGI